MGYGILIQPGAANNDDGKRVVLLRDAIIELLDSDLTPGGKRRFKYQGAIHTMAADDFMAIVQEFEFGDGHAHGDET